jgi:hypothetical protein
MMGANYRKPNQETREWDMIPRWMNISLIVLKWMMVMIPFIICSTMMFVTEMNMNQEWMWTCIYIMSLMNIINMTDKK